MNVKAFLEKLLEIENPENYELQFGMYDGGSGDWYEFQIEEFDIDGMTIEFKENKKYLKDKFGFPFDELVNLINHADEVFKDLKDEYFE